MLQAARCSGYRAQLPIIVPGREPHLSVTVRRLRERKSCWHVIAISQASIAAPTLTVMQGFEAKKDCFVRIEPGYDGWKLNTITITLCCNYLRGRREIIEQLDVDAEGVENDQYGYNTDVLRYFHQ